MEKARSMRLHKRVIGSGLVERAPEPALISIGLPILPGLTLAIPGLVEINGGSVETKTSSTHAATTAAPTPTPTHSSTTAKAASTGGSGGSSGGNGATTQTGSSSTPTGSSSGDPGSPGNGSGGGSGGGGGNGGGSSDSNDSGGDNTSVSGSLSGSAPGSTPTASSGIIPGSGNPPIDQVEGSSNPNSVSSNGSISSGATLSSNAPSPVVNLAGDPSATGAHTTDSDGVTIFVSGSVTVTSALGSTSTVATGSGGRGTGSGGSTTNGNNNGNGNSGNGGGGGGGDTPSNGPGAASSGKVSAGVIAAICVVVGLALLILFLFGLRRWHKKRRTQRLLEWANQSKKGGLFMFGAFNEKPATAGNAAAIADHSPRSARSSFGTTIEHTRPFSPLPAFDQSLSENSLFFTPLPSPSASAMRSETSIVPDMLPVSIPQSAIVRSPSRNSSQFSIGSDSTHGSQRESGGAQYLSLPPMYPDNMPQLSPISVRPFSPSESWAFPKPPTNPPTPSMSSRPLSGDSRISVATEMPVPPIPVARAAERTPTQDDATAQDPFADSQSIPKSDPFADPELTPTMLLPAKGLDIPVRRPASSGTMRTTSTAGGSEVSLGILDVIRRPFVPTLADELAVTRGDQIRILQCFDDGWAQIEKMETGEAGLIPVDCLREAGEDLPEFLAARRVSSYYGGVAV